MSTEAALNERFARFMRKRLRVVSGGELPPVSVITARFNHADNWQRPLSAESMRRWLRGMSLPELSRLPALCRMLQCSPGEVVDALGLGHEWSGDSAPAVSAEQAAASQRACEDLRAQINSIMRGMDEARLRVMVAMFERRSRPREAGAVALETASA